MNDDHARREHRSLQAPAANDDLFRLRVIAAFDPSPSPTHGERLTPAASSAVAIPRVERNRSTAAISSSYRQQVTQHRPQGARATRVATIGRPAFRSARGKATHAQM
jgi:hypothetical protein